MFKRILILLALICRLFYAQGEQPGNFENRALPDYKQVLHTTANFGLKSGSVSVLQPVSNKLSFLNLKIGNSPFKEVPLQLEIKDFYSSHREQPTKLTKLALSQMLFAGMGVMDYAIKEAPMYPGYRKDTFFWQSAWGGLVWGSSIGLNMLVVKDVKYIIGLLTEDMSYYICRKVFHKQNFPTQFGLPFSFMGANQVPMRTMIILWAASVTYLALDALDVF